MKTFAIIPMLFLFLFLSCENIELPDGYVHQSADGIISIEAEHFNDWDGWRERIYYTSVGIGPLPDTVMDDFVDYVLWVREAGDYHFHVLGNRNRNEDPHEHHFRVDLIRDQEIMESHGILFPDDINATVWSSIGKSDGLPVVMTFPRRGLYTLRLLHEKGRGYYVDKMVLARDPMWRPSGMGPAETLAGENPRVLNQAIVLPPSWAFGVVYGGYTNQEETIAVVEKLIEGNYPIDAYWIDSWFWDFDQGRGPWGYIDFTGDTVAYPDVGAMWNRLSSLSVRSGFWIWDIILKTGNEEIFEDFLERDYFSATYINRGGWHNSTRNTLTGAIDFENPEAVAYWKALLRPFFEAGLDFLKLDNSSAIPFTRAAFEATQEFGTNTRGRGFVLSHLHSTYDSRYKLYPTKWTGDAMIGWTQPDYPNLGIYAMGGFKENIAMAADPRRTTYDIPFLTHDAGGYDYFGSTDQSDELYMRWVQFAAMNTMMTIFSAARNETRNHPYGYSEAAQENFRKYTHLRMRLFPYIYSYALATHLTGQKMVRGDGIHEYQYLFGEELLVAPVYEKGQRSRTLFLPEGQWIDFETLTVYEGNQTITIDAPITKLPLFVRAGAIIPMRNYARAVALGSNDTLSLMVYPTKDLTSFTMYEDDGTSNDYLQGILASTTMTVQNNQAGLDFVIEPVDGSYEGIVPHRHYHLNLHLMDRPLSVSLNGQLLQQGHDETHGWYYHEDSRLVVVSFSGDKSERLKIEVGF